MKRFNLILLFIILLVACSKKEEENMKYEKLKDIQSNEIIKKKVEDRKQQILIPKKNIQSTKKSKIEIKSSIKLKPKVKKEIDKRNIEKVIKEDIRYNRQYETEEDDRDYEFERESYYGNS